MFQRRMQQATGKRKKLHQEAMVPVKDRRQSLGQKGEKASRTNQITSNSDSDLVATQARIWVQITFIVSDHLQAPLSRLGTGSLWNAHIGPFLRTRADPSTAEIQHRTPRDYILQLQVQRIT